MDLAMITTLTGHTQKVITVCWSPDSGGQVVSGSSGEIFRLWDVKSRGTDAKMIATGGYQNMESSKLLKTI